VMVRSHQGGDRVHLDITEACHQPCQSVTVQPAMSAVGQPGGGDDQTTSISIGQRQNHSVLLGRRLPSDKPRWKTIGLVQTDA
jgi:hypothetical protein